MKRNEKEFTIANQTLDVLVMCCENMTNPTIVIFAVRKHYNIHITHETVLLNLLHLFDVSNKVSIVTGCYQTIF